MGETEVTVGAALALAPQVDLGVGPVGVIPESLPSPLSVTRRRRFVTPVMSMSMVAVGEVGVRVADWVSIVAVPFHTWNRTVPLAVDLVIDADHRLESCAVETR